MAEYCVGQYAIRIYAKRFFYIYTQFFWDSLYRVSYILGIYYRANCCGASYGSRPPH